MGPMFKMSEIKELMRLVDSTSIQHLEIENEHGKLCIRKPEPAPSHPSVAHVQPPYPAVPPVAAAHQPHHPIASVPAPAAAAPVKAEQPPVEMASLHKIVSPMVGTFYSAPAPGSPDFVKPGDAVSEKTVVCIVEAMKLMNEIEAEVGGHIVEALATNGQLVEYGQPLFLVKR